MAGQSYGTDIIPASHDPRLSHVAATFVFAEFALVKSQRPKYLAHLPLYRTDSNFGLYVPVTSLFT